MNSGSRRNDSFAGRKRSFGGCGTCRARRTKCDERRPTCAVCVAAKVKCLGYEKSIIFNDEKRSSYNNLHFRRPLLTEEERQRESEALTSSIPPRLILRRIAQIDEECERALGRRSIDITKGPFSAFTASPFIENQEWRSEQQQSPSEGSAEHKEQGSNDVSSETNDETDMIFLPIQEADLLEQPALNLDCALLETSFMNSWWSTNAEQAFLNEPDLAPAVGDTRNVSDDVFVSDIQQLPKDLLGSGNVDSSVFTHLLYKQLHSPNHLSIPPAVAVSVPHDALYLLKHYSNTVLRVFTPFRHSKTPWHILFVPHVKGSLAALSLGEEVDHAGLVTFYGTLAISASSLGNITNSNRWKNQSLEYRLLALHHVHLMLRTAYVVPKAAKYKSLLMALLTMVQLYYILGDRDQFECYLLETEKLIRVKGLNRMKSRKVRLLHHCYVFERLIYESTLSGNVQSPHRQEIRAAIEISNSRAHSKDSLSFSVWKCLDLDREIFSSKDQDRGENDLHLQIPGIWNASLYPEIFGVSELHMTFLSMIIRLSRSRDSEVYSMPIGLDEFMKHAKSIEKGIYYIKRSVNRQSGSITDADGTMQLMGSLGEVMALALAIYFYRVLYNVERDVLQDKIRTVRECIVRFEADELQKGYGSVRLIWLAVVAAREAEEPELQMFFANWLEQSAQRTGLSVFTNALHDVKRHWA